MMTLHKKLVVNAAGHPLEVIVPYAEFLEMEEALGLDLDTAAQADLQAVRKDWEEGREEAFVTPESLR